MSTDDADALKDRRCLVLDPPSKAPSTVPIYDQIQRSIPAVLSKVRTIMSDTNEDIDAASSSSAEIELDVGDLEEACSIDLDEARENCDESPSVDDNDTVVLDDSRPVFTVEECREEVAPYEPLLCSSNPQPDTSRKRRNVSFPNEYGIISAAYEPVDPWKNVKAATVDQVISCYTSACEKLGIKPLEKLIKQLKDCVLVWPARVDKLDLRGCKLESRACEALEEVFKRVQFTELNVEGTNLDDDGATALFEMVEFYEACLRLAIGGNPRIGLRGWQAASHMIRSVPCLTCLDARRAIFTDHIMAQFGRCLKLNPPLSVLRLEGSCLSGKSIMFLATALRLNTSVRELYIGENKLSATDSVHLAGLLRTNKYLEVLDLRNNSLQDTGFLEICEALCDQFENGLTSLVVWNNGITHQSMKKLYECLTVHQKLQVLNLGKNKICDEGIFDLKLGLMKAKLLKQLGLASTKMSSTGMIAIAEYVADSKILQRLDLRKNNIDFAGLMALSHAIKVNTSLLKINLEKHIKREAGMEVIQNNMLLEIMSSCQRNREAAIRQGALTAVFHGTRIRDGTEADDSVSTFSEDDALVPLSEPPSTSTVSSLTASLERQRTTSGSIPITFKKFFNPQVFRGGSIEKAEEFAADNIHTNALSNTTDSTSTYSNPLDLVVVGDDCAIEDFSPPIVVTARDLSPTSSCTQTSGIIPSSPSRSFRFTVTPVLRPSISDSSTGMPVNMKDNRALFNADQSTWVGADGNTGCSQDLPPVANLVLSESSYVLLPESIVQLAMDIPPAETLPASVEVTGVCEDRENDSRIVLCSVNPSPCLEGATVRSDSIDNGLLTGELRTTISGSKELVDRDYLCSWEGVSTDSPPLPSPCLDPGRPAVA